MHGAAAHGSFYCIVKTSALKGFHIINHNYILNGREPHWNRRQGRIPDPGSQSNPNPSRIPKH